jgi:anti-sigma B factor antagonist
MPVHDLILPGGIGVLEVRGSFLGGKDIDEFRLKINQFIDRGTDKLIIDLGKVTFINSSAVGLLVSALISYTRRNWQIRLCGENKVVYTILKITKISVAFKYYDTREEAIRSLA